ncbi:MAG: DUF669 domain-containing protein [Planctomycetota bacterium]
MSDLASIFGGGFDTNSVPPQEDYDVLPPGKYPVMIEKAEVKQTKAGNGHYLALTMVVIDGPHKNRKVFDNINIQNPNQQCQEIGLRTLAALGQAVGLPVVNDENLFLNKLCVAHVKVKDGQNDVRTYSGLTPPAGPGAPGPQPGYPPPQPASPPQFAPPQQYPPPQQQYAPPPPPYAPPQQQYPPQPAPQYAPPAQQAPPAGTGKPPWAR